MKQDLFGWAMLGFALTESVGLIAVIGYFFHAVWIITPWLV
jgi:F0F1-type ATP synthase membrane subunit c/vacuolar-type H+-ATPase subunit K